MGEVGFLHERRDPLSASPPTLAPSLEGQHIGKEDATVSASWEALGRNLILVEKANDEWSGQAQQLGRFGRRERHLGWQDGDGMSVGQLVCRHPQDLHQRARQAREGHPGSPGPTRLQGSETYCKFR